MLVLIILWCVFWGALAAVLGASDSLAMLVGVGSVIGPLIALVVGGLLAAAIDDWVLAPNRRRKARKRRETFGNPGSDHHKRSR